jgi:hypothetical protein
VIVAAHARGGRAVVLSKVDKKMSMPVSVGTGRRRNLGFRGLPGVLNRFPAILRFMVLQLSTLREVQSIGVEEPEILFGGPVIVQYVSCTIARCRRKVPVTKFVYALGR